MNVRKINLPVRLRSAQGNGAGTGVSMTGACVEAVVGAGVTAGGWVAAAFGVTSEI